MMNKQIDFKSQFLKVLYFKSKYFRESKTVINNKNRDIYALFQTIDLQQIR